MKNAAEKLNAWQDAHRRNLLPAGLAAFGFAVLLNLWNNAANTITYTPLVFLAVFWGLVHVPLAISLREGIVFGVLGLLFAFFITADPLVYTPAGTPRPWRWYTLPVWLFFAAVLAFAMIGFSVWLCSIQWQQAQDEGMGQKAVTRKTWLAYGAVLLACWLPVLLVFGPLRVSADSYNVIMQALGEYPLQDNHPVLYTLVLRLFLWPARALGNITAGAYLFALAQMAFVAGVLAYSLYWMRRQGCPALLGLLGLGYFALTPVFAINAMTLWKDIPFNAVLLLFCLQLYTMGQTKGQVLLQKRGAARFMATALAACFLRGNGFWLVLLSMLIIAVMFRTHWKRWLLLFLPFLLVVQLVLGPLYAALGLTRLGRVESASVPLQQVARAVQNGAPLSPGQEAVIESFIPVDTMKTAYVSASPDHIKNHPEFDSAAFDAHFGEFMGLWGQLFSTNKQVYLDAWLLTTLGYWKIDFHGWTALASEFDAPTPTGIVQTDVLGSLTGLDIRTFMAERTSFFTLSQMAFLVLFCAAHLLVAKRGRLALLFVPMLALWLGLLLGAPTYCEFRYMLVFAFGLPCCLFVALAQPGGDEQVAPV